MVYRNNAGRLCAGFISVCLETRWLGQKSGLYVLECFCTMASVNCHVADEEKAVSKRAAGVPGEKDKFQVRLKGRERDDWMGTEIGMLRGYGFQGQVTAGDGSDKKGKLGAGYSKLRRKLKRQQCKYERGEEGSSSNRHEWAAFFWRFVTRR